MTIEYPPFEDVFPIEHGDFPMSCEFSGVYLLSTCRTTISISWMEWIQPAEAQKQI